MILALSLSPALDKIIYIDSFQPGKLYRIKELTISAGGKGLNAARVAAQLGEKVCAAGFIAGSAGEYIKVSMKETGVETAFFEVEGETRTNINIIDRKEGIETELLETGPLISQKDAGAFMEVFSRLLPQSHAVICSGGLPAGLPADFYNTLIEQAFKMGNKVLLDASGEAFVQGIKASPYLVKPNLRELGQYAGRSLDGISDIIDVARQMIIKHGIKIAVISMGGEGAVLVTEERAYLGRVPKVDVINTIGSGDSMVAGFASSISRGYNIEAMFRIGLACAVANTQFPGAGYIEPQLVEKYSREVQIEEL